MRDRESWSYLNNHEIGKRAGNATSVIIGYDNVTHRAIPRKWSSRRGGKVELLPARCPEERPGATPGMASGGLRHGECGNPSWGLV